MKKLSLAIIAVLGLSVGAFAQNSDDHQVTIIIPEVALLDIEATAGKNFTQSFVAPTEAGLGITAPVAPTTVLWLNYSSIVTATETSRTISVNTLAANIPAGVVIGVEALAPSGAGQGTRGGAGTVANISLTPQTLVSGIGSCYTGDGPSNGQQLTYALSAPTATYSQLQATAPGGVTVTLVYTLSDN